MRIRFIQGHKVQQPDGNGPEYRAGEVYNFDGFVAETYGRKYVRRGYAVEEPAEAAPPAPVVVVPEATLPPLEPPPAAPETNAPQRQERPRRRRSS